MKKPTIDEVFHTATAPGEKWTNRQVALFHAFNPHGLVAVKRTNDDRISAIVDAGDAKPGAIIAYGTFNTFEVDSLMQLANHRFVNGVRLAVALRMLRDQITRANKYIEEVSK